MTTDRSRLLTIGHGASDRGELGDRLVAAGIDVLVDVRRFPGSRRNPDVGTDAMQVWVPELGIQYLWDERLGGRRSLPKEGPDTDAWWRVEQFRAYAAHTRTAPFIAAMDELIELSSHQVTAVMCSENVWWRCHRRLIADVAALTHDVSVWHVMPDGRTRAHDVSPTAVIAGDHLVEWPRVDED